MIHLITGYRGKGKTRTMIEDANSRVKEVKGSIVYIDQSMHHMYELNNKIRLINMKDFRINNRDEVVGFVAGMISQNRDIEVLYMDGLLKLKEVAVEDVSYIVRALDRLCGDHNIEMTMTLSMDTQDLEEDLQTMVMTAL